MDRREFMKSLTITGAAAGLPLFARAAQTPAGSERPTRVIIDGLDTSVVSDEFLGMLQTAGVDCICLGCDELAHYGARLEFIDRHPEEIGLATTVADIREAHRRGRIAVVFNSQHSNWLEAMMEKDASGTIAPFSAMRAAYELGLRILGICYQATNIFGGGSMDPDVPLTRNGRLLVEKIHELGMVLDVGGHTGERTSLDAIEMSKGVPVICTHTNVAALNDNMRAISDRLIRAIASTGGVIGITAVSDFHMRNPDNFAAHGPVSPQATLDVHLDQYEYVRDLVGIDHVALGPDFVWGWGESYVIDPSVSITFPPEALSVTPPILTVDGFEDISKLPNLVAGLRGRGWPEEDLDKLLGLNLLRVYETVWGS